ncbi:putative inorganic phosphate cotransporter [Epargyreus clarus]|uniref:putative inorganic phosphate cotransporter n=1 Tax=Epargyreus clarus TaxID=520877 RepID=UPI003C2C04F2
MDVEFLKHKFEDGHDGVITNSKFKIGVRHLQIVYMLVCTAVMGAMRGSSAVAILAMADTSRQNDTYIQIHDWNGKVRGSILSAFLFGYALVLVPAEVYLKKLGDKSILTAVLLINGGLCATMPTLVNKGGWFAVFNAQFLMGMTQACVTPVNQMLLAKWLPPIERNILSYFVHGGMFLGTIIALPISGMISEAKLGWELIFYSQAMMTLSFAIVWALLTASSPDQHHAVGDKEKEFINEALSSCRKKCLRKPWRRIIKSPQFWGVACAHAASNALFVFYLVEAPEYLITKGLTLKESTWQCMFPFIAMWLVYFATAPAIDWICKIGFVEFIFDLRYYRKVINTLGALTAAIGLTVLPNLVWNWNHLTVLVLIGSLGVLGIQFSGFLENIREMTQNYSGSLLMMTSCVASFVGATVPIICGIIIGDAADPSRWKIIFYILGGFYLLCNIIYIIFGNSDRQAWDGTPRNKFGYNNDFIQMELEDRFDYDGETKLMTTKIDRETAI